MIIDSHCHIYDEKLADQKIEILNNLQKENQIVVCCADRLETAKQCIDLANNNKNVYATVGVHPQVAEQFNDNTLQEFKVLIKNKKVIAIGEVGLDYYYDCAPSQIQKEILKKQIIFACENNLPIVFHVREATSDFLQIIKELAQNYKIKGVVHSFSGSIETAKILLEYDLYFGINGIITFKNANKMLDVVKFLPLSKMLIETDSPYLTPVPFRGKPNKPEYVKYVAEKIAELKQISYDEVVKVTAENAKKLFNIK